MHITLHNALCYNELMNESRKIAAYVRVSTQDQSTDLQKREIEAFIALKGWHDVVFYEDKASGTTNNRPMLKALLSDIKSQKINVIVIWRLDRFFRSLKDLVNTLQELNELGVQFCSVKDQIDLSTSVGRLMANLLGSFAQFEADLISERVTAGMAAARARGKVLGRPRKRNDYEIKTLRSKGFSLRTIARLLGISKGSVQAGLAL